MDPNVKKIINNGTLIRRLAPMLDHPTARDLAKVASLYSILLDDFGISRPIEGFEGCEQAQLLVKWITGAEKPDAAKMKEWTDAIWSAIADLVAGKLPK